ncbi:hypothetical protein ACFX2C_026738 [Malus domestica]
MKEVARLEAELRSPEPSYLRSILEEKDLKIQQMEREKEELKRERDLAQSLLESVRKAKKVQKGSDQCGPSGQVARFLSFPGENEIVPTHSRDTPVTPRSRTRGANRRKAIVRRSVTSTDASMLVNEIRKLEQRQKQLGNEANRALEVLHEEVALHLLGNKETAETIAKLLSQIKEIQAVRSISEESVTGDGANLKDEISRWQTQAEDIKSLEGKLQNVQKLKDQLVISFSNSEENSECKAPCSPLNPSRRVMDYETENKAPENNNATPSDDTVAGRCKHSSTVNVKKMQRMFNNAAEENIWSRPSLGLKERVTKLSYQKHLLLCQVIALEKDQEAGIDETDNIDESLPGTWELTFEEDRKEIIMLWHPCHVLIIHRTPILSVIQGRTLRPDLHGSRTQKIAMGEFQADSGRERNAVREMGDSARRETEVNKWWTDPHNMQNVRESAEVVAKLVGFCKSGEHISKEMFELNFAQPSDKKTWMGWNLISNLLHLKQVVKLFLFTVVANEGFVVYIFVMVRNCHICITLMQ